MFRDVTKEPAPPEMFPLTLLPETLFILLSVTAPLAISSDVTAFSAIFELDKKANIKNQYQAAKY